MKMNFLASLLLVAFVMMSFTTKSATHESNQLNSVIGEAMSAIRSSCPNATGKLDYYIHTVTACFAGGFLQEVHFYKPNHCPPNQICTQEIIEVGTVLLGCDGQVVSVTCGAPVLQ